MLLRPASSSNLTSRSCSGFLQSIGSTDASGHKAVMFAHATRGLRRTQVRRMCNSIRAQAVCGKDQHITWQEGAVRREAKEMALQQRGCVIWLTGLSGSGKSTVACTLEHALFNRGVLTTLLDGDNIRHGLNCNLGFCEEDRAENIRRVGEVTKLFVDSGLIALASFISPYKRDRDRVRTRLGPRDFIEVYLKIPLEVCEARDAKGLYKLARAGKIKGFTGIDDPYEPPENPEITLEACTADGRAQCPESMARTILTYLESHGYLRAPMANNAVKGPARAIADWAERRTPVLDYSI